MTRTIATLENRLAAHADTAKREWWSNYVKGAVFYGVPMAETRELALEWWRESDHQDPLADAVSLGHHPVTEVKLAGISILERILIPEGALRSSDLGSMRTAMDDGAFNDWNTCDWFCVKILHRLMEDGRPDAHSELLSWSHSATLWTKRASLVGFVNLLPKREMELGFDDAFVTAAGRVAEDQRRFCQTSVGWTMRELSVRRPSLVEHFLENHRLRLSREAITNASKKLDFQIRRRLLESHKKA
jgi:3-methyladenine DNA glycosylase AlkD